MARSSQSRDLQDSGSERRSILIVDDEPEVVTALTDLLESDFDVIGRTSAKDALTEIRRDPSIAVVVSDQRMPGMTGDEFLTKVRDESLATRVLITGYADLDAVVRAVNDGKIFAYISKPWDATSISLTILRAVEQYELNDELSRERALMRDLMENLPDAIYFKDLEQRYTRVNSPAVDVIGLDRAEDVLGRSNIELLDRERALRLDQEDRQIIESGSPLIDRVERVVRPDGRVVWYSATKAAIRSKNGQITGLVGVTRDVTNQVLAERERDLMLDLTRQLVSAEDIDSAIGKVLDLVGRKTDVSYGEGWLAVPGSEPVLSSECFTRTDNAKLFWQSTRESEFAVRKVLPSRVLSSEEAVLVESIDEIDEEHFLRKEIALKTGFRTLIGVPVKSREGEPVSVLVFLTETENFSKPENIALFEAVGRQLGIHLQARKDADSLRASEANLMAVIEMQTELVTRTTPNGTRLFVNPAFERFLGRPQEDILKTTPFDMVPSSYHDALRSYIGDLTPDRPDSGIVVPMRQHDGAERWISWAARGIFDDQGRLIELQSSGRDITEQVVAEERASEAHRKLLDAINSLPVGFALFDRNQRLQVFNERYRNDRPERTRQYVTEGASAEEIFRQTVISGMYKGLGADTETQLSARMELFATVPGKYEIEYTDGVWWEFIQFPDSTGGTVLLRNNITKRKHSEQALALSEKRFRDFAETASDWMWETDSKGRLIEIDGATYRAGDIGPGAVIRQWWADRQKELASQDGESVAGDRMNKDRRREVSVRSDTGEERVYAVIAKRTKDPERGQTGYRGTITDITARRLAERKVRESEAKLRSILDNAVDAILLHDKEGDIIDANLACLESLGYGRDEFARLNLQDIFVPGEIGLASKIFRPSQSRHIHSGHYRRKDGSEFPVEIHSALVNSGNDTLYVSIARDMTDWERLLEEVSSTNERFRTLIDSSAQGVLVHRNFKLLYANQALSEMLGHDSPDELLAVETCFAIFHEEEHDRIGTYSELRQNEGHAPSVYEVKCVRKDGETIYVENRAALVPWDGEMAICASLIDVTEKRSVEERLQQLQKIEAIGQLTGGIAHDFNNLLTVIIGNLNLLHGRLEKTEESKLQRWTSNAKHAAERGADLTRRLLAFSRRQVLEPANFDVNDTIANMVDMFERVFDANISLHWNLDKNLGSIRADPAQFESALLNLAVNARDAMPSGGRLVIASDLVDIPGDGLDGLVELRPGSYARISVTDTGTGMTEEVRSKVFEPFFTTKDVGKGTGLGLSMVFGFAKQSGGSVTVESEVGVGSTIALFFPTCTEEAVHAGGHAGSRMIEILGQTVLAVEDDPEVRETAVEMLEQLGCTVIAAASGAEALSALEKQPDIDVLFTDIVMPGGMNGLELAKEVSLRAPDVAILYTSGYAETAIRETGYDGQGHWLSKPYTIDRLAEKLGEVVRAQEARRGTDDKDA